MLLKLTSEEDAIEMERIRSLVVQPEGGSFIRPTEAPIYHPTEKEFQDPIKYIQSIQAEAEAYGICKIVPPQGWLPPFCIEPMDLEFKPRVQFLGMVNAITRTKSQWLNKLILFWSLRGPHRIRIIRNSKIDLFELNELVWEAERGFKPETDWSSVAKQMKTLGEAEATAEELARRLCATYFDLINPMNFLLSETKLPEIESSVKGAYNRKSRKTGNKKSNSNNENKPSSHTTEKCSKCQIKIPNLSSFELFTCNICARQFHNRCFSVQAIFGDDGRGVYHCNDCVADVVRSCEGAYGFSDCPFTYDLMSFGEEADTFKRSFFGVENPMDVPEEVVESTFWNLLSRPDSPAVMYGADLHAMNHGSGFPNEKVPIQEPLTVNDKKYFTSGWNLNNIANSKESVLRFIKGDVSGMKVPWLYVGMCFSTFCWHIEDHWTASINFLHFGEAKTWYGVPASQAEAFESQMKALTPQLFDLQPDILHQLVTNYNPSYFMSKVKMCRTDQRAGEFIVTFPRAYHAGFNQGFNFAEAVNFCTSDWISKGMECSRYYASVKRECVFSMEEVLCQMVLEMSTLTLDQAQVACQELKKCLSKEQKVRDELESHARKRSRRVLFENYEDDDRTCLECKTTVYFSAVACSCDKGKKILWCASHNKKMCEFNCPKSKLQLLYRYKINEMQKIVDNLNSHCDFMVKKVGIESHNKDFEAEMDID